MNISHVRFFWGGTTCKSEFFSVMAILVFVTEIKLIVAVRFSWQNKQINPRNTPLTVKQNRTPNFNYNLH